MKGKCEEIKCSVKGCENNISPEYTKQQLCCMHGARLRRNGSVNDRKRNRNFYSIIEELTKSQNPLDFEIPNNNTFSEICRLYYGNKCMECGWDKGQCEAHHKILKSRGGKSTINNAIVLCPNCHSLKHINRKNRFSNESLIEFLQELHKINK